MIRVLHVIDGLDVGGAEVMLASLLAGTDRAEVVADVISLTDLGPIAPRIEALGVPLSALGLQKAPADLVRLAGLVRRLRRDPPDLVATWLYESDLLGGIAARLAGIPVVWGVHQSDLDPARVGRRKLATVALCARLSHHLPRRVVVVSEVAAALHAERGYDAERFVVIPNGVDLRAFRPDPTARAGLRHELGLDPEAVLVGVVARFDPQKDHRGFLAAAARVVGAVPGVSFVLVGKGMVDANAELASWIHAEGLDGRVHLLGLRADLPRVQAALDVAVMPSAYGEAFSVALVEAMACGVPCVVTDVGDSARLVGEGGVAVPPSDPVALAGALQEVLVDDERRAALGAAARARVTERYALERAVGRYVELYREVVAEGSRTGAVSIFLPRLLGGGAERVSLDLAAALAARGHDVELVLAVAEGPLLATVPPGLRVVDLGASRTATAVPALARHLRATRPVAVLSALSHANLIALAAAALARTATPVVVTEHQHLSTVTGSAPTRRDRLVPTLLRAAYPRAAAVVAVSEGVADDLVVAASLRPGSVAVAPNPIDAASLRARARPAPDHPWLVPGSPPVAVAVGRLTRQKGFDVLLEAVAIAVERGCRLRLVVLGEGEERAALEARAATLGLGERVAFLGWTPDPAPWLAAADLVVLSSRWEGLPTVLLEALALGPPLVATDCPSGPREVLEGGRLGRLVPVEDPLALADAIVATVGDLPQGGRTAGGELRPDRLPARYDPGAVAARYEELLGLTSLT